MIETLAPARNNSALPHTFQLYVSWKLCRLAYEADGSTHTPIGMIEDPAPARNDSALPHSDREARRAFERCHKIMTIYRLAVGVLLPIRGWFFLGRYPIFDWAASYYANVIACLHRKIAHTRQKIPHTLRASIIGRGS